MEDEPIYIVALGASTAVGRDAWSSAAAVRAGISGFSQHPYMIDTVGEPMRVACVSWLDIDLCGVQRYEALLYPAIDQAIELLPHLHIRFPRIALALGLPSSRPGLDANFQPRLISELEGRYANIFSEVSAFSKGHAAGLLALDTVIKKFSENTLDACVVAGVDSYMNAETLEWLEECDQLHGAGPLNNAWGFIPGEGAGAVLLVRCQIAQRLRLTPLAQVLGSGMAFEPKRIKTQTVCIGEGLTQAICGALATQQDCVKVTDVYCDMNGESYRADEFGFTALRVKENFESLSDFVAPADCWGDVSAASGPLHIGLASIAVNKNYSNGRSAIIWASSESGERASALLDMRWRN
jgi:3-oxoacyl-[acyl-carrier-protein] synthase-1